MVEQLTHPAKDHLAPFLERGNLAIEELHDGLRDDVLGALSADDDVIF